MTLQVHTATRESTAARCTMTPPAIAARRAAAADRPMRMRNSRAKRAPAPGLARGERVSTARLSEAAVVDIRAGWAAGISQSELARRYGVHHSSVQDIVRGLSWRHVPDAAPDAEPEAIDTGTGRIQQLDAQGTPVGTFACVRHAELATGADRHVIAAACNACTGIGWR